MSLDIVRAAVLDDAPHGFLGRSGGVSMGDIVGLNCGLGSGDDPETVETNRRIAADATLPSAPLASVRLRTRSSAAASAIASASAAARRFIPRSVIPPSMPGSLPFPGRRDRRCSGGRSR